MNVRVIDLLPGDVVELAGKSAVFVARTTHPIWPTLELVIWRLERNTWSHDALSPLQVVGDCVAADPETRQARLRAALLGVPS